MKIFIMLSLLFAYSCSHTPSYHMTEDESLAADDKNREYRFEQRRDLAHNRAVLEVNGFRDEIVKIYESKKPYMELYSACQIDMPKKITGISMMTCMDIIAKRHIPSLEIIFTGMYLSIEKYNKMKINPKNATDYPEHLIGRGIKIHNEIMKSIKEHEQRELSEIARYRDEELERKAIQNVDDSNKTRKLIGALFGLAAKANATRLPSNLYNGCTTDFQCGYGQACINKTGFGPGTCAKVVDQWGNQNMQYNKEYKVHKAKECPLSGCL